MNRRFLAQAGALSLLVLLATTANLFAQFSGKPLGSLLGKSGDEEVVEVSAKLLPAEGKQPARLSITAKMQPGWHIYSLTQKDGGPAKTTIQLDTSEQFRLLDGFRPTTAPHVHREQAFRNLEVESHSDRVTWQAPLELTAKLGAPPRVTGRLVAMACNDTSGCRPPKEFPFTAESLSQAGGANGAATNALDPVSHEPTQPAVREYRAEHSHCIVRGHIEPRTAIPGGRVSLVLAAEPTDGFHVYALEARAADVLGYKPTLIAVQEASGFPIGNFKSNRASESAEGVEPGKRIHFHGAPVSWTTQIEIPKDAKPGSYRIAGLMGYQTCHDMLGCDLPTGVAFKGQMTVTDSEAPGIAPLEFTSATYSAVAEALMLTGPSSVASSGGFDPDKLVVSQDDDPSQMPIGMAMLFGFLGGLILNLMPCVLPVIGLKILAFVEQAGQDRGRVLALNLWYSAGIFVVFMVLASLAAFGGLGWGELFKYAEFNIALAAIVFVMGLSFLGVWEIPIPGFVGRGRANELAEREGASGAFFKGVITTVLATPCSGPFLASALAWAFKQPPHLTYVMFACMGLGMASPYLLIGAFPRLIGFLPRPGMWMETFKQIMGFVLFGTVVYILTFVPTEYLVPTVALLFGLWAACWWIGRTPLTAPLGSKLAAWAGAAVFVAPLVIFCFHWLAPLMAARLELASTARLEQPDTPNLEMLAWKPFSRDVLDKLTKSQKTVMVDFTADWCLVCKVLEKTRLNTTPTKELIEQGGVVPLVADWTHGAPEVTEMLKLLGVKQIPVLAIFPAGRPNEPVVLYGLYSQEKLLEALKQAGPSQGSPVSRGVASRASAAANSR